MHSDYPFSGQTSPAMYWPMANSRKLERLHFVCGHGEDVARAGDMEHQRSCCDHLTKARSSCSGYVAEGGGAKEDEQRQGSNGGGGRRGQNTWEKIYRESHIQLYCLPLTIGNHKKNT